MCDRRFLDTVANSLFFVGVLIGSFFVGHIADWSVLFQGQMLSLEIGVVNIPHPYHDGK